MNGKRQPCRIGGVDYESETAAAKALGIGIGSLRSRFCSSKYPGYASQYHSKINVGKRTPCSIAGTDYKSIGLAAREMGISSALLRKQLASLDYPDYICAEIPKEPPKLPQYRVKGKYYNSLQEIADMEGLTRERIRQKMNSPLYPDHQRV